MYRSGGTPASRAARCERAPGPTGESRPVEEDAGAVDEPRRQVLALAFHDADAPRPFNVLELALREARRRGLDAPGVLLVRQVGAVATAALGELRGGTGEHPLAARTVDALPTAEEERHVDHPRAVLVGVGEAHPFVRVIGDGHASNATGAAATPASCCCVGSAQQNHGSVRRARPPGAGPATDHGLGLARIVPAEVVEHEAAHRGVGRLDRLRGAGRGLAPGGDCRLELVEERVLRRPREAEGGRVERPEAGCEHGVVIVEHERAGRDEEPDRVLDGVDVRHEVVRGDEVDDVDEILPLGPRRERQERRPDLDAVGTQLGDERPASCAVWPLARRRSTASLVDSKAETTKASPEVGELGDDVPVTQQVRDLDRRVERDVGMAGMKGPARRRARGPGG